MAIASTLSFIWRHPLNQSGRWAALSRYIRWQLSSRLLRCMISLPFVNGTSLFARRGMTGATGNWYCGLHEYRDMGLVLHLLAPGDLFLDIGANVGSYTVLAAGAAGVNVIAVEPIPSTFSTLEMNIALNRIGHLVEARCVGVSDKTGLLRFTSGQDSVNHVAMESELGEAIEVPVLTVDELCPSRVPSVIKIDVEGHEQSVLAGASKTLRSPSLMAVVMETNGSGARYGVSDEALFDTMKGYGFFPYAYEPLSRHLVPAIEEEDNTVFVRDVAAVELRVREAPRFRLINGEI